MKLLSLVFDFLPYGLLLSLLGLPLALIVCFRDQAEYFTRYAEALIPWGEGKKVSNLFDMVGLMEC